MCAFRLAKVEERPARRQFTAVHGNLLPQNHPYDPVRSDSQAVPCASSVPVLRSRSLARGARSIDVTDRSSAERAHEDSSREVRDPLLPWDPKRMFGA